MWIGKGWFLDWPSSGRSRSNTKVQSSLVSKIVGCECGFLTALFFPWGDVLTLLSVSSLLRKPPYLNWMKRSLLVPFSPLVSLKRARPRFTASLVAWYIANRIESCRHVYRFCVRAFLQPREMCLNEHPVAEHTGQVACSIFFHTLSNCGDGHWSSIALIVHWKSVSVDSNIAVCQLLSWAMIPSHLRHSAKCVSWVAWIYLSPSMFSSKISKAAALSSACLENFLFGFVSQQAHVYHDLSAHHR